MQTQLSQKILVFRALKLGDMLCSIPFFRALRENFPQAQVTLISHPVMENLFKRFPHYVDRFVPFSGFPGMPEQSYDSEHFAKLVTWAQKEKFDLAFQLHGSGELSNPVVSLMKAKRTIGFYRQNHFCPDSGSYALYPEHLHETERCLSLLEVLGIFSSDKKLEYPVYPEDHYELRNALKAQDLTLSDDYFCLHPGASTEEKRWSPEGFAEIADHLADQGHQIVWTGSRIESALVERIRALMKNDSVNLAQLDLPLSVLSAVIKDCTGIVCNDTGVSHLATAFGKKSVVIFSDSDPKRWAPIDFKTHRSLIRPTLHEVKTCVNEMFLGQELV